MSDATTNTIVRNLFFILDDPMVSLANFLEDRIVRYGGEQQHTASNLDDIISEHPISLLTCIKICLGDLDETWS